MNALRRTLRFAPIAALALILTLPAAAAAQSAGRIDGDMPQFACETVPSGLPLTVVSSRPSPTKFILRLT